MEYDQMNPIERRARVQYLKDKYQQIQSERAIAAAYLRECEVQLLDDEGSDLMEESNLRNFLQRLIRRKDKRDENEDEIMLQAKLRFDEAKSSLAEVDRQLYRITSELAEIRDLIQKDEETFAAVFANMQKDEENAIAAMYREVAGQLERESKKAKEIEEALDAGRVVLRIIERMFNYLDAAHDWSTVDIWLNRGIIDDLLKYQNLSEAEALAFDLKNAIERYNKELRDVQRIDQSLTFDMGSGTKVMDLLFDNIFINLHVRGKIKEKQMQLSQLERDVRRRQELHSELYKKQEAMLKSLKDRMHSLSLSYREQKLTSN